jgi:hypothetical protein
MTAIDLQVAGNPGALNTAIGRALSGATDLGLPVLVNIGAWPSVAALVQRCQDFASQNFDGQNFAPQDVVEAAGDGALILTILEGAAVSDTLAADMDAAAIWAFTRHNALAWAPRRIRLNVIGLGAGPLAAADPVSRGRNAARIHAQPASIDDVVRTIRFIARAASMTGQFIRLGAASLRDAPPLVEAV